MNSFLEKLRKGMRTDIDTPGGEDFAGAQPPDESPLPDGTAVFAAYKKKGVPVLRERSGDSAGHPKKLITAENIEEITGTAREFPVEKSSA